MRRGKKNNIRWVLLFFDAGGKCIGRGDYRRAKNLAEVLDWADKQKKCGNIRISRCVFSGGRAWPKRQKWNYEPRKKQVTEIGSETHR